MTPQETKLSIDTINSAFEWRYAVKTFDPNKKISESDWKALQGSLKYSASSFGLQPWKFIVVQNQELKKKLKEFAWGQSQVEDCSHFVVLAHAKKIDQSYVEKHIKKMAEVRGMPVEKLDGLKQAIMGAVVNGPISKNFEGWTSRQVYIAMGSFLLTAALLKVDACPMEGIEPAKFDELLGLTSTNYKAVAAIAAGYRSPSDTYQNAKKVRFDNPDIFEFKA